ncbi:MAG: hypothetical protein JO143_06680 [Acetobacteraceae bacterium]|nr:hypothetical protein [Acetobacteraceae bacterium]
MSAASDVLAAGLNALTESVRAACNDPAEAIRLLYGLAAYAPPPAVSHATPIGLAVYAAAAATAALCRRAALASLARACADFAPTSYDDAVAIRDDVADAGDVDTYRALRDLRTAVVNDLTTRGAQLPRLAAFTRRASLPALTLADQLYADTTRADDLVAAAWCGSTSCPP